tara:strand:+ start:51 stop:692 length:642 start_codon:yes stop_codon:yes gene_type:complete
MTSEKKVGYHPGGSVPRRGRTTSRRRPTGRTVYKSRTTIPTRRVAKSTAKKQKSPYTLEKLFKNQIQNLTTKTKPKALQKLKPPTTRTPKQKAITGAKARGQAKIAEMRKRFNSLTPLQRASMAQTQRARATTGKPTSAQKEINNSNMQKVKQLSAPQKQMPRTTSRVGSTAARRRAAAMARRRPTGTTIPTRSTASSGKRSRDYSLGRRRFT